MLDIECTPADVHAIARLVNGLRDGDTHVYEPLIAEASEDPGRFLGAAIRLLLAHRSPDTTDPGLGLHHAARNIAEAMERLAEGGTQ